MAELWQRFEQTAAGYEAWCRTCRGRRADRAERALLRWLLEGGGAGTLLEIGCGTGPFAAWLAGQGHRVVGLDRSPAMLVEVRRRHPGLPVVLGDAHALPVRDGAVDMALFVTTLEFLERPGTALQEAVRVSRRGVAVWPSTSGASGPCRGAGARRGTLRSHAADLTIRGLRDLVRIAAGFRLTRLRGASTLFPDGLCASKSRIPLGDVIGVVARLAGPGGAGA
jgi:SAM-dependent methyltransferase